MAKALNSSTQGSVISILRSESAEQRLTRTLEAVAADHSVQNTPRSELASPLQQHGMVLGKCSALVMQKVKLPGHHEAERAVHCHWRQAVAHHTTHCVQLQALGFTGIYTCQLRPAA
jgi:hypothetical protein